MEEEEDGVGDKKEKKRQSKDSKINRKGKKLMEFIERKRGWYSTGK